MVRSPGQLSHEMILYYQELARWKYHISDQTAKQSLIFGGREITIPTPYQSRISIYSNLPGQISIPMHSRKGN
jgi:hypothetical protein